MILKDYPPNLALTAYIKCYRIVHFDFARNISIPLKAYPPKPEVVLHFFLRDNFAIIQDDGKKIAQPSILLLGQKTFLKRHFTSNNFLNFQIVFQPAALFRITGVPADEFTNQFIDAESIFPRSIRITFEKLQLAKTYNEMVIIGEAFATELISRPQKNFHQLDTVTMLMMKKCGNIPLDWLAKETFLCPKQFRRNFNERVGVNPKTYSQVIRFNKAFNIKNRYPNMDWLSIAIECGYWDYQHLVKDYKDFTGLTPTEFHLLENNSPESRLGLTTYIYESRIQ